MREVQIVGTPMGHQEAKKRIKNFEEVTLGYTPEQAMALRNITTVRSIGVSM